ncbi:hypothetical protein [Nocardioides sp. KR10-350]|uniref:hypothetical protein n=1 Tax=Nocardioides cheoyonin TaxID=3156615 RepID=UPI0032B4BF65
MLPRFETVRRQRPVDLVAPDFTEVTLAQPGAGASTSFPQPAPSVAVEALLDGPAELTLASGEAVLTAAYDGGVSLRVTTGERTTVHRSRRFGRPDGPVEALALTLTGTHLTAFTREGGTWTGRARVHLADPKDPRVDTHDEAWLAGLSVGGRGALARLRAGAFGQLGLRDLRLVSNADGSAYERDGRVFLTATSAGPGFFDTAHTSVWELHRSTLELRHRSDLFVRRRDGVYADHAAHLVNDGGTWLFASSTWGDFDAKRRPVGVTLARSRADLLCGRHVLDAEPLALPVDGLGWVGVWDPHLVHDGDRWLVGYVSARRYFDFHPVLATGRSLEELTLRAAATDRRATEGTTLLRTPDGWRVLASDGRDNPRGLRAQYPVFDLDLRQVGTLDAAYPSNIPWPTLVPAPTASAVDDTTADDTTGAGRWLLVGFDGTAYGGSLLGYGTHGDVVISRSVG